MKPRIHKKSTNKNQSTLGETAIQKRNATSNSQLVNHSVQAKQLKAVQEIANNSNKNDQVARLQAIANSTENTGQLPLQKKENQTGLPDNLKTGIEQLSGYTMDDVKVHYNSSKPAQLNAHAYAQGTNIHVAPGQEKHVSHEAWHVVQQKQGRVKSTMQMKGGVNINDDKTLEREADMMGNKASKTTFIRSNNNSIKKQSQLNHSLTSVQAKNGPMQMIPNLSPGTYVEVRPGGTYWYGYIKKVDGNNYEIVVGGTSRGGYGNEDPDAMVSTVPQDQVFLHPMIKPSLGVRNDDPIDAPTAAALKGRGYNRLTRASVEQNWDNTSNATRQGWDQIFANDYAATSEIESIDPFSIATNSMLRDEITVGEMWAQFQDLIRQFGIGSQEALADWKQTQAVPAVGAEFDSSKEFKIGWRNTAARNAQIRGDYEHGRNPNARFGEYTGHYNLGAGWLRAEGSYRKGDTLQQNEIIYQIWQSAHQQVGLDVTNPAQRKPLRQIIRNHVVNEQSQPILGALGDGVFQKGTLAYDRLLSTPNVRAALFLVKDRGRELGIRGIRSVELRGVDAHINLDTV
ncbi:MAG: DUF4157 domain-containing protein [Chitinophagales bacterium]|nr:DUF4157 domain-containing protein [Chitinophagales bacterium]